MKKFHLLHLWSGLPQRNDRRTPAAGLSRGVAKTFDKHSPGQNGPYDLALRANSPAVDDPQSPETKPVRFFQILLDNGPDIPRQYTVQVEYVRNRYLDRLFLLLHCC